jgi:hypothetical protein
MSNTQPLGAIQRDLITYSRLYDFPAYVKQADMTDTCHPENLPVAACADVRNNDLPVHTKAATYYSWVRYLNKLANAEITPKFRAHIEERLTKQAAFWGIEGDIEALKEKHASLHAASDLPDSAYAIVWSSEDGRKERHYRMSNAPETKVASEAFLGPHRDAFGFRDRQTIAKKILDKAAEFGVGLDEDSRETLEKQAGLGIYDPRVCGRAIADRVNMVANEIRSEVRDGMRKTANEVISNPALAMDPENCAALCETLDMFDRMAGLTTKYAEGLPRPEDIVYANPFSTAAEFVKNAAELITGDVFNKEQFKKLALADIRAVMGDEIANAVAFGVKQVDPVKMAEIAGTFDRGTAKALVDLMAEAGQSPVIKHAAHTNFSAKELADLAQLNRFVGELPAATTE